MNDMLCGDIEIVSLDLWDTILRRSCHPDEVKLYTAQRMLHLLPEEFRTTALTPMELFRKRQSIEAEIGQNCTLQNGDDEYEIEEVLRRCLEESCGKSLNNVDIEHLVAALVADEIAQEIAVTSFDRDLLELLEPINYSEIIVISDFYMSAEKVDRIIQANEIPLKLDKLFVSCDLRMNKRSGRLFNYVAETVNISPSKILHIGDNLVADVEMASQAGYNALHFRGKSGRSDREKNQHYFELRKRAWEGDSGAILSQSIRRADTNKSIVEEKEQLREYGRYLCPLFAGFACFIQECCHLGNHDRVYFFTREGIFFKKIFDLVKDHNLFGMVAPQSRILPISRLASFFPSLPKVEMQHLMRLWSQYHTQSLNSLLLSLNLELNPYQDILQKNGINPDMAIEAPWRSDKVVKLFSDAHFISLLSKEHSRQRRNLLNYFSQERFGDDGRAFIVDIGWRGTIQDNLAHVFPELYIEGCYLGLQEFFNEQPHNTKKHGFIADLNTGCDHIMLKHVMPYEMLCFATGGSATGYRKGNNGEMVPEFRCDSDEDNRHDARIRLFQEGVLEGVHDFCNEIARRGVSLVEIQNEARSLAHDYLTKPTSVMCNAFNHLKQDDTFGMARTIFPGQQSFRLSDRFFTYFSLKHRQRLMADLDATGWPQCALKTRYGGIFYHLGRAKHQAKKWFNNRG